MVLDKSLVLANFRRLSKSHRRKLESWNLELAKKAGLGITIYKFESLNLANQAEVKHSKTENCRVLD